MSFDPKAPRIVVGDSDRAVLELIQIRLDIGGYHACVARTGEAVLELLKTVRPSALLIDAAPNGARGLEVLQAIADGGGAVYPLLLMGRNLSAEDVRQAIYLGARDCISKPFSGADILERVARALRAPPRTPVSTLKI